MRAETTLKEGATVANRRRETRANSQHGTLPLQRQQDRSPGRRAYAQVPHRIARGNGIVRVPADATMARRYGKGYSVNKQALSLILFLFRSYFSFMPATLKFRAQPVAHAHRAWRWWRWPIGVAAVDMLEL